MKPFFSVIIPVYNVAPYLRACLDSILAQTFIDWECICVDDGSTDGSAEILDEYAAKEPSIYVIHQKNAGVSSARNRALAYAQGAFVCFADGDDIAYPWWLETFAYFQRQTGADLVRVQHPSHRPFLPQAPNLNAVSTQIFDTEKALLEWGWHTFSREGYSVLYAVRRQCVGDIRFDVGIRLKEDNLFALALLPKIQRVIQCDVITYWYRYRAESAIRRSPTQEEVWQWIQAYIARVSKQLPRCKACHAEIRLATSRAILRECMAMVNANAILCLPELLAYCRQAQAFIPEVFPWRWRLLLRWCESGPLWLLRLSFYWIVCKRSVVRWWSALRQRNIGVSEVAHSLRQFQLFVEPTEYILDLIEAVHGPRGITCAFAYDRKTLASQGTTAFPVVEKFSWSERITYLWQVLKQHDVISIHSYADSISVTLLMLNLFWRRICVFEVDSAWREPKRWIPRVAKRLWLGFWFRRSYVWGSAIGAQVHREFFLKYGLPETRLTERPNVVKNARYARVQPPIPSEAFCFGYVGRLVRHKGVQILIEAFREVVRRYPRATLSIVGDGPELEALQKQAADLPQVIFHGAVYGTQKVTLQHQMDALCLVSTYEPWGLVVNEALASGTPCIVTQCCGCVEPLIKTPCAGIVIPENDTNALITAMCTVIQNPIEAAAMGQRGANFLHTEWNYTRYAHNLDTWLINLQQCGSLRFLRTITPGALGN